MSAARGDLNASGLPDPTAAAAIARADRSARRDRLPSRDELRRMRGPQLGRLAWRLGLPKGAEMTTNDRDKRQAIAKMVEKARKGQRKEAAMAAQEQKAQKAPDYTPVLRDLVRAVCVVTNKLDEPSELTRKLDEACDRLEVIAGKLDDLTCAVMELQQDGGAGAKKGGAGKMPAADAAFVSSYVERLDPLFLVGREVTSVYEEFVDYWRDKRPGISPPPADYMAARAVVLHPLHVEDGRFAPRRFPTGRKPTPGMRGL